MKVGNGKKKRELPNCCILLFVYSLFGKLGQVQPAGGGTTFPKSSCTLPDIKNGEVIMRKKILN